MLITLARIAEAIDWPAPEARATGTGASSNRGEQRSGCTPLGVTDLAVKSCANRSPMNTYNRTGVQFVFDIYRKSCPSA
jgi:hypothetical protein